ncbi:MAG: DUF2867 domain-containing protein [Chloroflexi bacterium]|nr:DUF2867 domain-containing protein [Chloroflexota bacterium]
MDFIQRHDLLCGVLADSDHYDHKTIDGSGDLRAFLAGMINYDPPWMTALYAVRAAFVRLLGMRQGGIPRSPGLEPEDIDFEPGAKVSFFRTEQAEERQFWVGVIPDKHLTARLIVAAEPLETEQTRFHVGTVVHYQRWTGPLYFNVIRPFHHLVVSSMMRAAQKSLG